MVRRHGTVGSANMFGVISKWRFERLGLERRTATGILAMALVAAVGCNGPARQGSAPQLESGSVSVVQPGAPGTPSRRLPASTSGVAPLRSQADIEFMQGMITHHSQAV